MSIFGAQQRISFNQQAEGIWGEFSTPAGRVGFLMTKARLASNSPDLEGRLTRLLCPVREVLNVSKMNFNQLLQRDLDDHRVATKLLPYIIQSSITGPAFFPPILAALLPFSGARPAEGFPSVEYLSEEKAPGFGDQPFEEWRYGHSYHFQRMINTDGSIHPVKFGRLGWNEEAAKLVVLDGQHRAMALLAIERTLSGSWDQSTGSKYRHFYEHRVESLLKEAKANFGDIDLSQVEYPVTLCWFPEYHGESQNPHVAARKLFIDVNKNARKPSESRLVLLSDTELVNIFTRSLLNRLREDNPKFPLITVEYDNPHKETSRPVRWSVFTNITMLRDMVEKAVFGPPKYIRNLGLTIRGRTSEANMDTFMRQQLKVKDLFPAFIDEDEDQTIKREELGNSLFPQYNKEAREKLINQFIDCWGNPILHILGELLFFKKHVEAVQALRNSWVTDDSVGSLAFDAMFEGVGMYWTLRESDTHWREKVQEQMVDSNDKPDIVKAWTIIESKGKDFALGRANKYLGSATAERIKESESFYSTVNTYACQVGAVMTLATLADRHQNRTPMEIAEVLTKAWNASLLTSPMKTRDRRLLLGKDETKPLNMIPKMDSPHAIYFRYFFLQFLMTDEAKEHWDGVLEPTILQDLVETTRRVYFNYLVKEKIKGFRRTEPSWTKSKREEEAQNSVKKELFDSLKKWFETSEEEFNRWLNNNNSDSDDIDKDESGVEDLDNEELNEPDEEIEDENLKEFFDILNR